MTDTANIARAWDRRLRAAIKRSLIPWRAVSLHRQLSAYRRSQPSPVELASFLAEYGEAMKGECRSACGYYRRAA
jgi:hypothetical protein